MTVFVESSALVKRYIQEPETPTVLDAMERDPEWIGSALAQTEAALTLCHAAMTEHEAADARRRLDEDWGRFIVLPADNACLLRAVQIGCGQRIRTLDAIHLAAADRLPRPLTFLTFDLRQAIAAQALGFNVVGVAVPSTSDSAPPEEETPSFSETDAT